MMDSFNCAMSGCVSIGFRGAVLSGLAMPRHAPCHSVLADAAASIGLSSSDKQRSLRTYRTGDQAASVCRGDGQCQEAAALAVFGRSLLTGLSGGCTTRTESGHACTCSRPAGPSGPRLTRVDGPWRVAARVTLQSLGTFAGDTQSHCNRPTVTAVVPKRASLISGVIRLEPTKSAVSETAPALLRRAGLTRSRMCRTQ
jgi:hypothetical protein